MAHPSSERDRERELTEAVDAAVEMAGLKARCRERALTLAVQYASKRQTYRPEVIIISARAFADFLMGEDA